MEIGPTETLLSDPRYPHTRVLLSVIPVPNPRRRRKRMILVGETANPIGLLSGCLFHLRGPAAMEDYTLNDRTPVQVSADHEVA